MVTDVSSTSTLLTRWEVGEYVSAIIVIVGVIGEFIADFTNICGVQIYQRRKDRLGKLSTLVLLVGLALELFCLARTNSLSGQEIAFLNTVAADARVRAANAEGAAKGFESKIAEAQRGTAEAGRDAEIARKNAEQIKLEAEELRKQNLVLQTDVLKLQEKLADRHLSPEQQKSISAKLSKYAPLPVMFALYSADGEMERIASDIRGALPSTWMVGYRRGSSSEGGFSGIRVELAKDATLDENSIASELVTAFKSERLTVSGPVTIRDAAFIGGESVITARIRITIGRKP